jgi:hypothetical protein
MKPFFGMSAFVQYMNDNNNLIEWLYIHLFWVFFLALRERQMNSCVRRSVKIDRTGFKKYENIGWMYVEVKWNENGEETPKENSYSDLFLSCQIICFYLVICQLH